MPEHDTYDLDAAFARLEQDIAGVSSPRGAGLAVTTARRRRRATVGAIALATVLAVGGVAVAQGAGRHDSFVEPAASLPSPAPLDARSLTAATRGWTSSWDTAESRASVVLDGPVAHCLNSSPVFSEVVEPSRTSGDLSFAAGTASTFAILNDFGSQTSQADRLWTAIGEAFSTCGNATPGEHQLWDDGEAVSYSVASDSGNAEQFWIARHGSAIGLLFVADAPESMPADTDDAVATAIVAALQDPDSYTQTGATDSGSSTSSSSSAGAFSSFSEVDFEKALGSWQSGWKLRGGADPGDLGCGTNHWGSQSTGEAGTSVGANGAEDMNSFSSAGEAQAALAGLAASLQSCSATPYAVHTTTSTGGDQVTVAVGPMAVWIVRSGADVGLVRIPMGGTPPPDAVSARVGQLVSDDLGRG